METEAVFGTKQPGSGMLQRFLSRRLGLGRDRQRWRAEGPLSGKQTCRPFWNFEAVDSACPGGLVCGPHPHKALSTTGPGKGNADPSPVMRGVGLPPWHPLCTAHSGRGCFLPSPPQGPGGSQWPLWLRPLLFRDASPTPSLPQEREILRAARARLSPPRRPFSVPTPQPGTRKQRSYDITSGAAGPQS